MKKIAIFDLDGTVYTHTLSFDVAETLMHDLDLDVELTEIQKAKTAWKERGSNESYWIYNKTVLETFERVLPRVNQDQMKSAVEKVLATKGAFRYGYTTNLIGTYKKEGRILIAISGSIKDIVEPFAHSLGFDIVVSSELERVDGVYTGKRVSQTNKNKKELLTALVAQHHLTFENSVGVGDTHRDISFLELVAHPIAFNPNAALYEEAAKQGWKVVVERKNMVYELGQQEGVYVLSAAHPIHSEEHQERFQ